MTAPAPTGAPIRSRSRRTPRVLATAVAVAASAWAAEARADLDAGATWIVTEGRESGTVGLFEADGSIRGDVADAVVEAVGVETTVFEAPRKEQQAWLVRRFGADVNLAAAT